MLEYEKRLHFDERYKKMQSNNGLHMIGAVLIGILCYGLLSILFRYLFGFIPDIRPWGNGREIIPADIVYVIVGGCIYCYAYVRLSRISVQNHSVRGESKDAPKKLLIEGYYAKIRHPMYGTFIMLQAGFLLSLRSLTGTVIACIIVVFQYGNALFEEKRQLIPLFGKQYVTYRKKVPHIVLTRVQLIVMIVLLTVNIVGFIFK